MKKIFASIGVVALGAAAVHGESATTMGMGGDNSKIWSVAASLRGFYDDNYTTAPNATKRDSFGASISPSVSIKIPMDQTTLGFRYIYGATWYADRQDIVGGSDAWDQSHQFDLLFSHAFNPRFSLDVSDSFVISQEPELINPTGPVAFPYRSEGDNIRNHGEITLNGGITKRLSFVVGYQNTFYDYENSGVTFVPGFPTVVDGSLSGLLDRIEHEVLFNLRYQVLPKTVLVGGYNYKQVDYTSDEFIANAQTNPFGPDLPVKSDVRNSRSHIIYGGVDQNFTKDLILRVRAGAEFVDKYNSKVAGVTNGAPVGAFPTILKDDSDNTTTSPWGNISLSYNYLPGSSVQVGFTHSRSQTDVVTPDAKTGRVTSDQETSLLYGTIYHRFTPKLNGRFTAQWQDSEFYGGLNDGEREDYYDLGINFSYSFTQHFSGEVGYNYSKLDSDAPGRDFDRNRVYLGVTAAY